MEPEVGGAGAGGEDGPGWASALGEEAQVVAPQQAEVQALTVMPTVVALISAPPLPVLPWSLLVMLNASAPE